MRKISSIILSMILILSNIVLINMLGPVSIIEMNASAFPGGDGSSSNPFQISNVTELQNMSANLSAHYILINDIDASNTTTWNWNGTIYNGFMPIANDTAPGIAGFQGINFTGSLDGQGYNITGLFINRSTESYVGLFGKTNSSAVIKNVNLVNFTVYGDEEVAGLIGWNEGGTVTNCSADGNTNVPGIYNDYGYEIGGLIGHNTGTVTNCIAYGNMNGTADDTGGLIGWNEGGLVMNCTSFANVTGEIWGGGCKGSLIGWNDGGTVINCTAYGYALGYYDIGGLIGFNWFGTVINCTAYGNITGGEESGGLIGDNVGDVTNCRAYGNVSPSGMGSEWSIGGLLGVSSGNIINCSSYGNTSGNQMVGGLIGLNDGDVINCTAYGNTTGIYGDCWGVGGLIGENYAGTITNCSAFGYTTGFGTFSVDIGGLIGYVDKGTIQNCVSYNNTDGEEDVGGLIGFNGGTVINCTAYGDTTGKSMVGYSMVGGLIGWNDGVVANCTAYTDVNGTGFAGGLIGWNEGLVTNCNTYGNINGTAYDVGGLIGWNDNTGTVIDSNAYGDIDCYGDGGGLIGFNVGKVTNCSVYGTVNGTYYLGGLIGSNEGIVTNCTAYNYINGTEHLGGLIGYNDGVVANCTAYSDLNGTHDLGGLIGYNWATVTNCIAYGNINGTYGLGGLIGQMDNGAVTDCTAFGNVTGAYGYGWNIGGLIGAVGYGTVTNCDAYGNVIGTYEFIGGLIGFNYGEFVTGCTAYGDVNGTADYVGGLIGENCGIATNCTAYGNTSGRYYVGGLFGASYWTVTDCTAYGNVTGNRYVGGLIGFNEWYIRNSTAYGNTTGTGDDCRAVGGLIGYNDEWGDILGSNAYGFTTAIGNSSYDIGGLIGNNSRIIINCSAYANVTGNNNVGGLIGDNSGTLINCSAFGNATGNNNVGGLIGDNSGFVTQSIAYGNTTGNSSVGGLIGNNSGWVTNCTSYGVTTGDLFVGGLVGYNTGTILNCTSYGNTTGNYYVGGVTGYNNGTVKNCTAYGNTSGGSSDFIGGLIGYNNGIVTNSSAYGNTTGDIAIGGLIGLNLNAGTVFNCTAFGSVSGINEVGGLIGNNTGTVNKCGSTVNVTVTGDDYIGGLIGNNSGTVTNSFSHSPTTGDDYVGGLIGNNSGSVTHSYSVGFVTGNTNVGGLIGGSSTTVTGCFWDNETSGYTTSAGGVEAQPRNTTEMMDQITFTNAGWDFYEIWGIDDAESYPFFMFWYNPPVIITLDVEFATEDILYIVDYDAIYSTHAPGNGIDNWNLSTNASGWLSIDANGVLSGTPTNDDIGSYWVNVTVTDLYNGSDSQNFTLTVSNVNDPPSITTPNNTTAIEDVFYSMDYDANDIDPTNDILSWNYSTNASWLNFNKNTAVLYGIPVNSDVGNYWVNVSVKDNYNGEHFTNFSLTVINVNDDPIITTADVTTATEDILYYVDYEATDVDPTMDTLTWTLKTNTSWLSINSITGNLSGTPTNDYVGSYWVNVTVDDGIGGTHSTNFTLTVFNVNDDPVITTTSIPKFAFEDLLYTVDFEAEDVDITGDKLTWHLSTNASWLDIDSNSGVLSGTPTNDDIGSYWVRIIVDDGKGGTDFVNFTLNVNNANNPPTILTSDILTATEDELYSVDYDAIDIDPTGDTLTWSLTTNAGWLAIDSITGILTGTPTNDDINSYQVNVTVSDGNGGLAWHNFTLTVENVNDPPFITTVDVVDVKVGELYSVDYNATDIDPTNDDLTWTLATSASGWLTINPTSGLLSGTPSSEDAGDYWVNVTVNDGNGGTDWHYFILTVESVPFANFDPIITTTNVITAPVDELYSVQYDAADDRTPIADLDWAMKTNATWLSFDTTTRVLAGTPSVTDVGQYWVYISVEDGEDGLAWTNFTITVPRPFIPPPPNNEPKLANGKLTPESGDTETVFTFSVTYTDEDNDTGEVFVWFLGERHLMTPDPDDTDYSDGIEYIYKTKLPKGKHTYYFTGDDGTDAAESTDTTPTTDANAKSTPKIAEPTEKEGGIEDWILYLIIIIIVIILIVAGIVIFKSKQKMGEQATDEEQELEDRQEVREGGMTQEYPPTEYYVLDSDEVLRELKQESLRPEKPSESGPSAQDLLNQFEIKYQKGEISRATYDSITEFLGMTKP